jgi:Thermolysin metallopeptidase, catalytic domain
MTYGDGDGRTFNPFDSLDVAGHETWLGSASYKFETAANTSVLLIDVPF